MRLVTVTLLVPAGIAVVHNQCHRFLEDPELPLRYMFTEEGYRQAPTLGWRGKLYDPFKRRNSVDQLCWSGNSSTAGLEQYLLAARKGYASYGGVLREGGTCDRNWLEGTKFFDSGLTLPFPDSVAPAILGMDPDIIRKCPERQEGRGCTRQPFNMLGLWRHEVGLLGTWNMCRNFEFILCGALGMLPQQRSAVFYIATAPSYMEEHSYKFVERAKHDMHELGEYRGISIVTVYEYCLIDWVCANAATDLWNMTQPGYFTCEFDDNAYAQLKDIMIPPRNSFQLPVD